MNTKDRDALWARLDERSLNTWRLVEKIDIRTMETSKRSISNSVWIAAIRWVIVSFVTIVLAWMSRLQGWWG